MKKVSIVIPAHNEEKRIGKTLEAYGKFFESLKKNKALDFEIIVVLNACGDNTIGIAKGVKAKIREIKILEFKQAGKGFAIMNGFENALSRKNDLIGFVDADMATHPEAFYELVKKIGNYDGIIANRWKKGAVIKTKQAFLRRVLSRGFNFIVRSMLLLPYSDTQCGAKLFKRKALGEVINKIETVRWAFDVGLLYVLKKEGFKIHEIPTEWEDKKDSTLDIAKVPFQMFSSVIRLRLKYSPFKFIVRAYHKIFPEKIKIYRQ